MPHPTRRSFLKNTLAAAASITIAGTKSSGRVLGANDTIHIAVAGINGRGGAHVGEWTRMDGVEITYLIDPDTRTYARRLKQAGTKGGKAPQVIKDVRVALEDKNLDAISIATPNHWHALITIWACQAGKDVYVEKPCSHNIHEGRIAVEAAKKYGRIVQHGTQSRSSPEIPRVLEAIKSGKFGKLLVSRGLCYKDGLGDPRSTRASIGYQPPKPPPQELDFNLWLGPAKEQPYHDNLVHYRWHWFWDFGNGDIGNQGVHEIDKARWAIPGATLPRSVLSLGGRLGHKQPDQGQTASSQIAIFDYGETQLIFEVRGLPSKAYQGQKVGNIFHLEAGTIAGGRFYPKGSDKGEPLFAGDGNGRRGGRGGNHFANFIAAVRSRKMEDLAAPILEGHYSAALIHLANASYRLGEQVPFNPATKAFGDNKEAYETLARMEEYLKENKVHLSESKYQLGRKLTIDAGAESVVGDNEANKLLTRNYRKPFAVPDKI
ncbi:MAG TPA: Gfo/Idh/MocA family oxidoreductase [Gemmataceae bacterium]|nr:Gfo/Idh/MocA family oxidoreductase [Gemmataceae bacterium]